LTWQVFRNLPGLLLARSGEKTFQVEENLEGWERIPDLPGLLHARSGEKTFQVEENLEG